jgi:predicted SAM-dependent methyltransferase
MPVKNNADTRFCPLCEQSFEAFQPKGNPPRPNRRCPVCKSNRRNRTAWLFLKSFTNLFDQTPKRFLHIAPEERLERKFREIPNLDYLSADLDGSRAMVAMDIQQIRYPDHSFDVIYCSHVLEHVSDDVTAMQELFRVLQPGGWALVLVPIKGEHTFEDNSVTDPAERERLFGQEDHVRRYGRDISDRLVAAGFHVRLYTTPEIARGENFERMGLLDDDGGVLFYCVRPDT